MDDGRKAVRRNVFSRRRRRATRDQIGRACSHKLYEYHNDVPPDAFARPLFSTVVTSGCVGRAQCATQGLGCCGSDAKNRYRILRRQSGKVVFPLPQSIPYGCRNGARRAVHGMMRGMDSGTSKEKLESLLELAQQGNETALERLFLLYRSYLVTLARPQIRRRLQGKVDASDLAQEAMLEAHRCFAQFRGASMPEFAGWLRGILAHRLAHHARRFLDAKARDANLERSLAVELENASSILDHGLVGPDSSPSEVAARHESNLLLSDALE